MAVGLVSEMLGPGWLLFGLFGVLGVGLKNGGAACVQHYVLRILLWRNDYAPLNYVRFLDYATERVFLRKVGGGYIFTNRLLMEYFAMLPAPGETGAAPRAVAVTTPGEVRAPLPRRGSGDRAAGR